jgi:hypothetical protein
MVSILGTVEALLAFAKEGVFSVRSIPAALEWCSQYGSLGILHQAAFRIQRPSRWYAAAEERWFASREWEWIGGRWRSALQTNAAHGGGDVGEFAALPHHQLGTCVPPSHSSYEAPYVYFRETIDLRGHFRLNKPVPASELMPVFFPQSAHSDLETFDCPRPDSEQFWRIYCEPIEVFEGQAMLFTYACNVLYRTGPVRSPRHYLERYLAPLSISVADGPDGDLVETWNSPSLLCTFARMALQDAMAGYTLYSCECCGSPFVRKNPRAQYCSTTCGYRHRKRRARSIASSQDAEKQHGKETRK